MLKAGAKLPPGAHRHVPEFLRLLRAGSEESGKAGGGGSGYAPLLALLRGMSASAIDRELRAMQVLEGFDAGAYKPCPSLAPLGSSRAAAAASDPSVP